MKLSKSVFDYFPSVKAERLWTRCQLCSVGRLTEDVPCCLNEQQQARVSFLRSRSSSQSNSVGCVRSSSWSSGWLTVGAGQAVKPAVSLPILGASPCKGNRRPARIGLPACLPACQTPQNIERLPGKEKSKPASIVQQLALNWLDLSALECRVFRKVQTSLCKSACT